MISIILRAKNEEQNIGGVLEAIFSQEISQSIEVIIVDSGSTDRTLDIAGQFSVKILTIAESRFSYGYALNFGISASSGDIICCLSAHCVPAHHKWLSKLIEPIVEGRAHATYGRQIPIPGVNPFEEVSLRKHFPEHDTITGRVPFSNANCAFLRDVWNERKFDETIPSWEDYLWFSLLKESYVYSYAPLAAVRHSHPFSLTSTLRRTFNDGAAFRIMNDRYNLDLVDETAPTLLAKLHYFLKDILEHFKLFIDKRYVRYIVTIPFVRILTFKAYRDGYNSAEKTG